MIIPVYRIRSTLTQVTDRRVTEYIDSVAKESGHTLTCIDSAAEFAAAPFGLLYVASGGSEGFFLEEFDNLTKKTVYILTSGESNSLAASMEILSCLHKRGKKGEILHGSPAYIARRVDSLARAFRARQALDGASFGCVGAPSNWLIASTDDDRYYREKLGLSVVRIPIEELIDESRKNSWPVNDSVRALENAGWDRAEMEKALSVYGGLSRIVKKYHLKGVTVRCFDLLEPLGTTGCLALALLNEQGIYAGCEGDVPSLVSMAILGEVSGEPVFMCNPSRIDTDRSEMVLAHCTLPFNMPKSFTLMTHYESNIGVALRGKFPLEVCTIFKTDTALDRFHAQRAELLENPEDPTLCRTQIRLKVTDTNYFLTRPINNHHLIAMGDHTLALNAFFETL